jgi:hypothetical protein
MRFAVDAAYNTNPYMSPLNQSDTVNLQNSCVLLHMPQVAVALVGHFS